RLDCQSKRIPCAFDPVQRGQVGKLQQSLVELRRVKCAIPSFVKKVLKLRCRFFSIHASASYCQDADSLPDIEYLGVGGHFRASYTTVVFFQPPGNIKAGLSVRASPP